MRKNILLLIIYINIGILISCKSSKNVPNYYEPEKVFLGDTSSYNQNNDFTDSGLESRKVIYKNWKAIPMTHSGKVTVKTCINRAGEVTYTEILSNETTINNKSVLTGCLKAAKGYKYEANYNAPKEQCGRIAFNLNVNRFR